MKGGEGREEMDGRGREGRGGEGDRSPFKFLNTPLVIPGLNHWQFAFCIHNAVHVHVPYQLQKPLSSEVKLYPVNPS